MDINNFSDDDLKQLMEKYKEKKERYDLMYNEATQRTERIILLIHLEQVRRCGNMDSFITWLIFGLRASARTGLAAMLSCNVKTHGLQLVNF